MSCAAGATPNTSAVATDTAEREREHRRVELHFVERIKLSGRSRTRSAALPSRRDADHAGPSASTRHSANSARTSRHVLAPSAERSESSRARDAPRASNRFATFEHATSSTRPTAASNTSSASRALARRIAPPAVRARVDARRRTWPRRFRQRAFRIASSSLACRVERLPPQSARSRRWLEFRRRAAGRSNDSGNHTSGAAPTNASHRAGMTPTTTCGTSSSVSARPSTSRAPP